MYETSWFLQVIVILGVYFSKTFLEVPKRGYVLVASGSIFVCLLQRMTGRALIDHQEKYILWTGLLPFINSADGFYRYHS